MADEHLRELEREAKNGDPLAARRLELERCRAGQCCAHRAAPAPKTAKRGRTWWTIESPGSAGAPESRWPMPWYCRWTRKQAIEDFEKDRCQVWPVLQAEGFRAVKVQPFRVDGSGTIHISD